MKMVALYRFWWLFLLSCVCLWGSPRQALAQQQAALVDAPDVHFVDYWMRANAAFITPQAQQEIRAGRVRPSFSSTLHPIRYGLISATNRRRIVGTMDLFCLNQGNRSLILACRSRATTHERFVHVSSAACAQHQPLSTILPSDCEHPYVITRTGRTVTVPNVAQATRPRPTLMRVVPPRLAAAPQPPPQPIVLHHRPPDRQPSRERAQQTPSPSQPSALKQTNVNTLALLVLFLLVLAFIVWKTMTAHKKSASNALPEDLKGLFAQALEDRDAAYEQLAQVNAEQQRLLEEKGTQARVLKEREREIQHLRDANASLQGDARAARGTIERTTKDYDQLKKNHDSQTLAQKGLRDRNAELERHLYALAEFAKAKGLRLPVELTAFVPTQPPPANFKVSPPRGTPKEIRETYPQQGAQMPRVDGAIGASHVKPHRDTPPGTVLISPHESTQPQVFLPEARPQPASSDHDSFMLLFGEELPPPAEGRSTLTGLGGPSGDDTQFFNAEHLRGSFVTVPLEDQTVSHTPTKKLLQDASPTVPPPPPPSFAGPVAEVKSMRYPTLVVDEGKMARSARESLTVPSTFPPKNASASLAPVSDEAETLVLDEALRSLAAKPPPADLVQAVAVEPVPAQDDVEHSGARLLTPVPPDKQQTH